MNQFEVPALIADEIPQVRKDVSYLTVLGNVDDAMQVLTAFTKKMIISNQLNMVNKCMELADRIYRKGNQLVRNSVENIFIFSFSTMRLSCNKVEWKLVQAKIPIGLYSVYMQQVMKSGC